MPIAQLARRLRKERERRRDAYASLARLSLSLRDPLGAPAERFSASIEGDEEARGMSLTPHALAQLCRIAGMPRAFVESAPASVALGALRTMLRVVAEGDDRRRLFRYEQGRGPRLVAVLPQSYVRLADVEVLEALEGSASALGVQLASIDDDVVSVRLLRDEKIDLGAARGGDDGVAGIHVVSSETGRMPLQVRQVLLRIVCTNGITALVDADSTLSARYTGFNRRELEVAFAGAVEAALGRAQGWAARLVHARQEPVEDAHEEISRVVHRFNLGGPTGRLARWVRGETERARSLFGVSRFDVVQSFTAVARGLETAPRLRVEDAMGTYLERGLAAS